MFTTSPTTGDRLGGHMTRAVFDALPPAERLSHVRLGGTVDAPVVRTAPVREIGPGQISREVFETLSAAAQYEAVNVRRLVVID